jgi:hypothetical protein
MMQNPLPAMQSFIFGEGTDAPTYESLKRRRQIADLLQLQASQTPKNVGEGIGAIGKALLYKMIDKKIGPQEDAERERIAGLLGGLGGGSPVGGAQGGFTGAGFSGTPETLPGPGMAPTGSPVAPALGGGNYREAIAGIESSGDYSALGPVTGSGDRAYGKYQVMGANIPEWTQAALGQPMPPEQVVANPQAQDAVFDHRFGGYVNQYGPEGAASMWFSGDPTPDGDADQLGTSDTDYVAKFMQGMGGGGMMGGGEPDMARVSQLADVLGNPYATEGQRAVAQALIERELAAGGGGITPYQAARLGLDNKRLELDERQLEVGNRGSSSLNLQYSVDAEGNLHAWQTLSSGGLKEVPLPEGQNWAPGTGTIQTPTQAITIDKRSGQTVRIDEKDVAGAAAQTEVGKTVAGAAAGLPAQGEALARITAAGQEILSDPVLPEVLGNWQGRLPPRTQAQADTQAKIDRFLGQTFPMAMQSLRGLGPASEREGVAAQAAIANLDQKQSPEAFAAAINEAIGHIQRGFEIAEQQAQGNVLPPASGGTKPAGFPLSQETWDLLPPEDQKVWLD